MRILTFSLPEDSIKFKPFNRWLKRAAQESGKRPQSHFRFHLSVPRFLLLRHRRHRRYSRLICQRDLTRSVYPFREDDGRILGEFSFGRKGEKKTIREEGVLFTILRYNKQSEIKILGRLERREENLERRCVVAANAEDLSLVPLTFGELPGSFFSTIISASRSSSQDVIADPELPLSNNDNGGNEAVETPGLGIEFQSEMRTVLQVGFNAFQLKSFHELRIPFLRLFSASLDQRRRFNEPETRISISRGTRIGKSSYTPLKKGNKNRDCDTNKV